MVRSLVTGGGGFLGANLVRALVKRGDLVNVIVRKESNLWRLKGLEEQIKIHYSDLSGDDVEDLVTAINPQQVFHLAQYGGNRGEGNGERIREVCINGTAKLYDACIKLQNVPTIVHTGSSSEYGEKSEAMSEDMLPEPKLEYGIVKLWATLYGEHLHREKGFPVTTLRLFSAYGPFEADVRFFPACILAFLSGRTPMLASADTVRDFVFVDDVVEALMLAHGKPAGIYNIGTGTESTLKEVVEKIQGVLGNELPLVWGEDAGRTSLEVKSWKADITKAGSILEWRPKTSLQEGIEKTVEWFQDNKSIYDSI